VAERPDQAGEGEPGRTVDLLDHVAIPLPDGEEHGDGDDEDHDEADPTLDPVHVRIDGLNVVREEVSEGKGEGNAEQRGEPIGEDELPKGDSRDPSREEGSRAKAGDVTSRHDGLHGVPAIRDLEAALAVGGEEEPHGAPPEHSLSAIASRPVQDHVARKHSQEAHEQPRPGGHEPFVTHHAGGDDRHLLGNGQPEASREKDEVDPEIGELLDERLNRLHELPQAASRVPATEGTPDGGNRLLSRRDGTKGPGRFFAFPIAAPGSRSSSIETDARG